MVQCGRCEYWVHATCEAMSGQHTLTPSHPHLHRTNIHVSLVESSLCDTDSVILCIVSQMYILSSTMLFIERILHYACRGGHAWTCHTQWWECVCACVRVCVISYRGGNFPGDFPNDSDLLLLGNLNSDLYSRMWTIWSVDCACFITPL